MVETQHLPLMFQILGVSADEPQAHGELSIPQNTAEISFGSLPSRTKMPIDMVQSERGNCSTMASASCSGNYNADPGKANSLSCKQGHERPLVSTVMPFLSHDGGRGGGTIQLIRFAQNVGGSRRFLVSRSGHVFVARGIPVTSLVSTSISNFIHKLLS